MKRTFPLRLAVAVVALGLAGTGVVVAVLSDLLVRVTDAGVGVMPIPFWGAMCGAIGIILLLLIVAVPDIRSLPRFSAPLLLALWLLQVSGGAGIYRWPTQVPPGSSWFTRYTAVGAPWWGLATLLVVAAAVVVWARLKARPATGVQDSGGA